MPSRLLNAAKLQADPMILVSAVIPCEVGWAVTVGDDDIDITVVV